VGHGERERHGRGNISCIDLSDINLGGKTKKSMTLVRVNVGL
jgi:hypothetical protein